MGEILAYSLPKRCEINRLKHKTYYQCPEVSSSITEIRNSDFQVPPLKRYEILKNVALSSQAAKEDRNISINIVSIF